MLFHHKFFVALEAEEFALKLLQSPLCSKADLQIFNIEKIHNEGAVFFGFEKYVHATHTRHWKNVK